MSQNLNVALTLSLNDRLSNQHNRTMQTVRRNFAGISDEITRLTRVTNAASGNLAGMARNIDRVLGGLRNMARAVPAAIAGLTAAKFVLGDPIRQTQSYDRRLADMSNTAFNDRSLAGRQAGMMELDASVVNAVRTGGGTRESAADTLNELISSGVMSAQASMKALPTIMRAATASNSDPKDLAQIAMTASQNFGIKGDDLGKALDMAVRAGTLGGFEVKDMARHLPAQMAAASGTLGMSGLTDFGRLLASNQASVMTSGTKDAAGNNLLNLLAKINAGETAKDFGKVGIDLPGSLAHARGKGMNAMDAFVRLVDKVVSADPRFTALKNQAAGMQATDPRRAATLSSMADIMMGSSVGKVIQDRQALMSLISEMMPSGRDKVAEVVSGVDPTKGAAFGAVSSNYDLISTRAGFKAEQLANEKAIAMQTAMESVNPLLGQMADNLVNSAREHPKFTAAVTASTLALTALAAAAGAAGFVNLLKRPPGVPPMVPAAIPAAAPAVGKAAAGAAAGAGAGAALAAGVGGAAAVGATAIVAYGAGTLIHHAIIKPLQQLIFGKDESFGTAFQTLVEKIQKSEREQDRKIDIRVFVENGNIFADVMSGIERSAKRR